METNGWFWFALDPASPDVLPDPFPDVGGGLLVV